MSQLLKSMGWGNYTPKQQQSFKTIAAYIKKFGHLRNWIPEVVRFKNDGLLVIVELEGDLALTYKLTPKGEQLYTEVQRVEAEIAKHSQLALM